MKKFTFLLPLLIFLTLSGKAQTKSVSNPNDTADFPYWIQMMQDPHANFFRTQRAFNLYWHNRKITKGCGWKVFKRWEYMMQSRVNPDGSLPAPDETFKAIHSLHKNTNSSAGNWVNLGPTYIPSPGPAGYEGLGRLNVIAFHPTNPSKIYVGSPSGGFWKSADAGNTWTTSTDTLPTLGVSAIVVDQSNTEKIFIGTGDRDAGDAPGLGIFVSSDGGNTWSPSKSGMGDKTVGRIIQHPANSMIFLAATSGGVYRSSDGGSSWTLSKAGNFKDICFKPGDPNIVYAAFNADFYRSSDNGVNFTKITSGLPSSQQRGVIAVSSANPNYVYFLLSDNSSGYKGLYRSSDAGITFSTRSTTPNILNWDCGTTSSGGQGWYDLALAVDPVNAEIVYVGGVNVFKSINGGTSWTINSHWYGGCDVPAVHADCHFLTFSPVNGKLWACNDGGLYVTDNGGSNWVDRTEGMTIGQIYKLGQSQTVKEKVINGFQDNGTYTYTATGWLQTGGGDGMECAIDPSDASYIYYTIYYGDVFRQHNGNEVQVAGQNINGEQGAWVTPFILGENDPKYMFVGLKNIWRCTDVRANNVDWTKISDNLAGSNSSDLAVLEQSPADPNILYAVRSDNKLFRTDNALGTDPVWSNITANLPVGGTATDLEASPADANVVYMTLNKKVYKSTNKGLSWTDITGGLPNISLNSIAYYKNSNEGLYVGSDAGVYYKDASFSDWISFSEGLPDNGRVTELEIYYDNANVSNDAIRASTYGRGLWGSSMCSSSPTADFQAEQTLIPTNCAIDFTDLSSGIPTHYLWTFEGGTPSTSSLKNPTDILYPAAGSYFVKLKVWNSLGTDSTTKTNYITVSSTLIPQVDFTASNRVPCSNDTVHFTDLSINCPLSWNWQFTPATVSFLEGTSNSSRNPVVQFNQTGAYEVRLTVTNGAGSNTLSRTAFILSGGYNLPFTSSFENGLDTQHWTVINTDGGRTWDTIHVPGTMNGTKSVWMNFFSYSALNTRDQLVSPPMDFTNYVSLTLTFHHAYAQRGSLKDSLIVYISEDCGLNWTRLLAAGPDGTPNAFVTFPPASYAFYPTSSNDWCGGSYGVGCYSLNLTPWVGKKNVKLMFESFNRSGNNLFIHDVQVNGTVGLPDSEKIKSIFRIFPNPSNGQFTLETNQKSPPATLTIYNINGMKIYTSVLPELPSGYRHNINLYQYPKGVYYIQMIMDNEIQIEKLIVK